MAQLPDDIERLALIGWRLCPVVRGSRAGCFRGSNDAATHDLDRLAEWSRQFPGCGWRVVMEGSGIWALDCDAPGPDHDADGLTAMASLVRQHGPLPAGPRIKTGGGGVVLFFKHNGEPIIGKTGTPAPGLDPRRGRLTVTLPPSIHHRTGQPYRWITPPWKVSPPSAPGWLLSLVKPPEPPPLAERKALPEGQDKRRRYALAALESAVVNVAGAVNGSRNHTLNAETFSLLRFAADGSLDRAEIAEAMAVAGLTAGMDRLEVTNTIRSALSARARQP